MSQRTSTRKHHRSKLLVPLLLAVAVSQAYAGTTYGASGAPGTHGTVPGAAGSDGGAGQSLDLAVDPAKVTDPYTEVIAGRGGKGGNGAAGQAGGAAGAGGAGGSATITAVRSLTASFDAYQPYSASAGAGGDAGTPGSGSVVGAGAAGGTGGNAKTVVDIAIPASSYFSVVTTAHGGAGGAGKVAGAGGSGQSTLTLAGSTGVTLSGDATAVGGRGGDAVGTGTGANGGAATSTAFSNGGSTWRLLATAEGGAGGDGSGAGHRGGQAGSASATVRGDAGAANAVGSVTVRGGAGGSGRAGAAGAAGGDVSLHNVASVVTTGKLTVGWGAIGGNGGASVGGTAGRGGNGEATLVLNEQRAASLETGVQSAGGSGGAASAGGVAGAAGLALARADAVSKRALTLSSYARGGNGGIGTDAAGSDGAAGSAHATGRSLEGAATVTAEAIGGNGGAGSGATGTNGGAALATALSRAATGAAKATANATGGAGGSASGVNARAGNGGIASATATGEALAGNASASVSVQGGVGGRGFARAAGGTGGTIVLDNAVKASGNGTLELAQVALAGEGGITTGGRFGDGGSATSLLAVDDNRASAIKANIQASGGNAGKANGSSALAGSGGSGKAVLDLKAGAAGSSAAGTAFARSGWVQGTPDAASRIGDATARSTVQADLSALSVAQVVGGSSDNLAYEPFVSGGNMDAFARAVSNGQSTATASAFHGGLLARSTVRAEAIGGNGTTVANANFQVAEAQVQAFSSARGAASNTATAKGFADRGTVAARSVSTGANGVVVQTDAQTGMSEGWAQAATSANVGGTLVPISLTYRDSLSHATALPDAATVTAAFGASPQVAAALADGQVVGIGTIVGAYSRDGIAANANVLSANFRFATDAPGFLVFGLLGSQSTDVGFGNLELTISNHGTELFSRSFTSLTDARVFFSDHAFNLGALAAGDQDLLLTAGFTESRSGAFGFNYTFGVSPVPEPQTWMLMLLGTTVVLLRRRRRG